MHVKDSYILKEGLHKTIRWFIKPKYQKEKTSLSELIHGLPEVTLEHLVVFNCGFLLW